MTRRFGWTVLGLLLAAAACSDIAQPLRDDFYEWRLTVPSASGTGEDSLSFHWPRNRLPVRVWAEDAAGLPGHVGAGIAAWRNAFLYDEFDATVVGDSSAADVIVRAGPAPGPALSRVRLHAAMAPECDGATDIEISDDHTQLLLPIRIYIDPGFAPEADLTRCVALTTTHELGHALGLFRHSDAPTDLMFADPAVSAPSDRDLETVEMIYHVPADLEPVGR